MKLDDDGDAVISCHRVETQNLQLPQTDKAVPVKAEVRRSQLDVPFIPIHNVEQNCRLVVKLYPLDIKNLPNPLKIHRKNTRDNCKQSIEPVDTQKTYSCHMCDKNFQYLCRLKSHMTAHSNEQRYKCSMCPKRYKSSSSLCLHVRQSHCSLDAPQQKSPMPAATPQKASTNKPPSKRDGQNFDDLKMDEIDLNDIQMEWPPLDCNEYMPFVWDENDLNLTLPMATEQTIPTQNATNGIKPTDDDQMDCVKSSKLKVSHAVDQPNVKVSPSKCAIWLKETDDPLALFVDILRKPKSKRKQQFNCVPNTGNTLDATSKYSKKATKLAIQFHEAGDNEFTSKKWENARHCFNCGLCYAEPNSSYISTAYAKRALCHFNEGKYQACRKDLMLAEKSSLPEKLRKTLEQDKKLCEAMINNERPQPASSIEPKLSSPYDPMFPEMVNILQIDCDEHFGRHIRARQSIAVGQILIVEQGFIATSTAYYGKCCVCLSENQNLMPCSRCTQAMLCESCVNAHRIECELQMAMNVHAYPWLMKVLRSFLNGIYLFKTIDEMMEFVADAITSGHQMPPTTPIMDLKTKYRAFLQLIAVPTIQPSLNAMVSKLHTVLLNHPTIGRKFQTEKSKRFLCHLLFHHICVINAFTTKVGSVDSDYECLEIIAPITSYLKHSCAPNVSRFLLGNSVIVVAMRPIEPNEQLFVSYCDILMHRNDRQQILQTEYGFQCQCERCTNGQSMDNDQQLFTNHCDAVADLIRSNLNYLTSDDQVQRKQLNDYLVDILQRLGRQPWNYTITRAFVIYSLLLSQRLQKKLQY